MWQCFYSPEAEENGEENYESISKMKSTPVDGLSPDTRGDEDEIISEQVFGDEEETIPDEFYYDSQEHFSKPVISDDSSLPSDVLSLVYPLLSHIHFLSGFIKICKF